MKFFRSTQSVELLQAAMEKTRRGASVFSAFKMVWVYFVSLGAQCTLLFVMSVVAGVSDGGDGLIGSITFGILLFERFLVGFQLALVSSYLKYSVELPVKVSSDSAIPDIQIRERVNWCDRARPWHLPCAPFLADFQSVSLAGTAR